MQRERLAWLRLGAASVDSLALAALWAASTVVRRSAGTWLPQLGRNDVDLWAYLPVAALVIPVWIGLLAWRGGYRYLRRKALRTVLSELIFTAATGFVLVSALLFLLQVTWISRAVLLGFAVGSVGLLAALRSVDLALLRRLRRDRFDPYRILIVGNPDRLGPWLSVVAEHPEWAIEPVGWLGEGESASRLPHLGPVSLLAEQMMRRGIDEVLVTREGIDAIGLVSPICEELGVPLAMDANFMGMSTARVELQDFEGWSVLRFGAGPMRGRELVVKRALDLAGALLGLGLLGPVLALAALAIKLEEPRSPVLFVQRRAGRFGRTFPMIKLRTMRPDAEALRAGLSAQNEMSGPVFKLRADPRVTRVGRWLRRYSIDELPQLYNVLIGQMSLVGPRPPLPEEVGRYARWQLRRLSVRPGLTCIWQVSGRNEVDFDRWMRLDLHYIDNWSLLLDLRLILRTVPAVLRGTGAS